MGGTAMDVLVEYAERTSAVARRYVGVTAYTAAAGVKRFRETAPITAGALPLSEQFALSYTAFPQAS